MSFKISRRDAEVYVEAVKREQEELREEHLYRDLRLIKRTILAKCSETNNVSSGSVSIDTGRVNESRTGCTAVLSSKEGDAYIDVSWKWEEGEEEKNRK
jgi:hypothetical protein